MTIHHLEKAVNDIDVKNKDVKFIEGKMIKK